MPVPNKKKYVTLSVTKNTDHMKWTYMVIEDNPSDRDRLISEANKTRELRHVGSYASAYEALANLRGMDLLPDFIFCDIMLQDENGLDAGPELARNCKYLVYVTGLPGLKGLVLDAMGDEHLQKPVTCDQIRMRALNRFFKRHSDEIPLYIHLNKLYILHTVDKKYYGVSLKNIMHLTYSKNYVDVTIKGSDAVYVARTTLQNAYNLVEPAGVFIKVNQGAVINMLHHGKWNNAEVWVGDTCFRLKGQGKKVFFDYIKRYGLGFGDADGGVRNE